MYFSLVFISDCIFPFMTGHLLILGELISCKKYVVLKTLYIFFVRNIKLYYIILHYVILYLYFVFSKKYNVFYILTIIWIKVDKCVVTYEQECNSRAYFVTRLAVE